MKKEKIFALMLVETFIAFSLGFIGPIYAIYFEKISDSLYFVPTLIGVYWICVGIFEPLFGKYIDRIGKKRGYILGCIITSIAIFLYPMASNLLTLFLAQIIAAIGYSIEMPSYYSLLAELTNRKRRGSEIGKIHGWFNITYGISAILSIIIIYYFVLEMIFYISGLFYLIAGLFALRLIEDV